MKAPISIALLSLACTLALGSTAAYAQRIERIQYNQYNQDQNYQGQQPYYDQRGYPDQRYNDNFRRPGPLRWRPGQVVPDQALNFVVQDWEERGLSRPPGGHQWFRVRQQFL